MKFVLLSLSMVLLATSASASQRDLELKHVVDAFYHAYIAARPSGIPSEKVQLKFKPFISVELAKLLQEADKAEQKYQKKTKGEVPPLVEGDIFTSLFEGATSFLVLSCDPGTVSCVVEFSYVDTRDQSSFTWKDKVYLVKESRTWMVDDIEFLGDWQFMHKGRLKGLLKQVLEEASSN